jgi:hypothetical protein
MMMTIMTYRQRKANNKNEKENVNETIQKFECIKDKRVGKYEGR